jgi:TonB family protein
VKSSDWKGALISLGLHGAVLLGAALLLRATGAPTQAISPVAVKSARSNATRVALMGRSSAPRLETSAAAGAAPSSPAAPVILRHRGPTPKQPQGVDAEVEAAAAALEEASAGGDSAGGDGLVGVLEHGSDALAGDALAAGKAETGVRQALEQPPVQRDLSRLSARLQAAAARCYPETARRFRQSGVATLEFCLDARGSLVRAAVQKSSGFAPLDEAATGCVLPGALPAGPEVGAGCFTLPVRFAGARE